MKLMIDIISMMMMRTCLFFIISPIQQDNVFAVFYLVFISRTKKVMFSTCASAAIEYSIANECGIKNQFSQTLL